MTDPLTFEMPVAAPTAETLLAAHPELSSLLRPDWPDHMGDVTGKKPAEVIARVMKTSLRVPSDREEAQRSLCSLAARLHLDPWSQATFEEAGKALGLTKQFFQSAVRASRDAKPGDRDSEVREIAKKFFHDSQGNYYRKLPNGQWGTMTTEQAKRHLRVVNKLSDTVEKGESYSEIDVALQYIETEQIITGSLPFPLNPNPIVEWNNQVFLNIARNRLMKPSTEEVASWGEQFPWLADYLDGLFINKQNRDVFLAWLQVWYNSALAGNPQRGQALFIAGPTGTGKSFLSIAILGRIFDGYADARGYFVDNKNFNHTMFDHAVWSLDDSTILGDHKAHQKFSGLVKAVVANPSFSYDRKWGYNGHVPFNGRFICTLNDDPISMGILPDTDQSLTDKVLMLRTSARQCPVDPDQRKRYEILDRELPFFLKWLVDMPLPAGVEADPRFGIKSWQDREVLDEARAASFSSSITEIVDLWRAAYLKNMDSEDGQTDNKAMTWTGTASQLYVKISNNGVTDRLASKLSPGALGRHLTAAIENGYPHAKRWRSGKARNIVINLHDHEDTKETV